LIDAQKVSAQVVSRENYLDAPESVKRLKRDDKK
jgi:hypothetical protein